MSETQDDTTTRTAIGNYGRLVVARCTGCKSTTKKRADVDPDGKQSFKHVCHVCRASTYWNVIDYVDDQDDRDGVDRGDGPITDGGAEIDDRTHLDSDRGLWIPQHFRGDGQIIIRTPRATMQHHGEIGTYYPLVDDTHFGPADQFGDPKNPSLAPDSVSIKQPGDDAIEFTVEIHPDIVTDGGEPTLTVDGTGTQLLISIQPVDGLKLSVAVEPGVSREEITDALSFADDEIAHVRSLDPLHTDSKDRIPTENHDAEIETVADGGEVDRGDGPISDGGERTTVGDLDDDRQVHHAGRNTGKTVKIHTDESCPFYKRSNFDHSTRAGNLHDDRVVCDLCTGEFERGGDTGDPTTTVSRLDDLDPEDLGLEPIGDRAGSGSV